VTSSLKAQLDDFEKEIQDDDFDGDAMEEAESVEEGHEEGAHPAKELQGEAPPPPAPQLNSDTKPVEQLSKPLPDSETPSAVVKAEGLMDGSEDPTRI